ncbi:MAG: sigma-70 family RNA polymerase sigma factor, partial [Kofleriaceae bacterium]|nr:sigma-70 family RNA polymerase sigma factor [Kofleriaceae bacterium]
MELATPDADLVAASRRGERAAFAALIERHLDAVRAVSFSTTRDRALSDDVVQDTFVAAWGQLDRLREVGRLRAWLCGIARNLARQARRRATREQPLEAREPRAAATPFDDLVTAQRRAVVEQAVAELPAAYREVLVLYYQHERSIRDVASALGLSEDAALQRLTRGRRLLATQVVAQIDDALVDRRPRRATVAAILAVLPPGLPSASAAASSLSRPLTVPGASMLKIAALALATAAAAGATY